MGASTLVRWTLPVLVLLVSTSHVAATAVPDDPLQFAGQAVDGATSAGSEAKAEAEATVAEAASEAKATLGVARTTAQATIDAAEDTVYDTLLFLMDAATIAYGYAEELVARVWADLSSIHFITQDKPKTVDPESGLRSQTASVAVAEAGTFVPLVWVAASTGAGFLLAYTVRRLLGLAAVPLLSRIAHSEIYNNDSRRSIHELVTNEPGLCLNEIVTRTGCSRNAVSYHLFVLEKEEAIVSVKDGKYRRYFLRNGKYVNGAKNVVAVLRNDTTLKLAQSVLAKPGAIQRDLCIELGATPSATCWHAKRLLELGVIRKQREANTVRYYPGEALAKYDMSDFGLPRLSPAVTGLAPTPA